MNEQQVIEKLNKNPYFLDFHKEFQGRFILYYEVNGVGIYFFNSIGGVVEAYLTMLYDFYKVDEQVKDFIVISKKILQQKVNSANDNDTL